MNNRDDIALYKGLGRRVLFLLMLLLALVPQFRSSAAQDQIPLPTQKPVGNKPDAGLFDLTQSLLTIKKAQAVDSELPPVPAAKPIKTGVVKKANLAQEANKKDLDALALDQAFHKVYLESGCMPVESLRTVFEQQDYL